MASDSMTMDPSQTLQEAFPDVDPGVQPLGGRVLVQMRRVPNSTKSGIVLVSDTQDSVKWNTQVARVVALGPLAYRNRETREAWGEGAWVSVGDFARVPRWNGDRFEIEAPDGKGTVTFVIFNDHEIFARVTSDPLKVKAFLL